MAPPTHPLWTFFTLVMATSVGLAAASSGTGTPPHPKAAENGPFATARLLSASTAAVPGKELEVAVQFKLAPGWHIYWENPGDSGLKTTVQLKASPAGAVGPLQYPGPSAFSSPGDAVSYGYSEEVVMFLTVTPDASLKPGATLQLQGEAKWLACQERCVREQAPLSLSLPVRAQESPPEPNTERLLKPWRALLPQPFSALTGVRARWESPQVLVFEGDKQQKLTFYPSVEQGTLQLGAPGTSRLKVSLPPETPAGKLDGLLKQELQGKVRYGLVRLQHPTNAP